MILWAAATADTISLLVRLNILGKFSSKSASLVSGNNALGQQIVPSQNAEEPDVDGVLLPQLVCVDLN